MKKLLLLPLMLLFLNCTNDLQNKRLNSFLNHETELTQHFFVAPDSIITIQGKKGTKISFKTADLEGILIYPNIKDSLKVNLIELTNKQDLLMANAQTSSNGKWLISGGAFKIEIAVNGETLSLKQGRTISVQFPKTSNEEDMLLFYGERDENSNMDWKSTNAKLQNDPFVIYLEKAFILDTVFTKAYQVDSFKEVYILDTLGYLNSLNVKERLLKTNSLDLEKDTLRILSEYVRIVDDNFDGNSKWIDLEKAFKVKTLDSLFNKKEVTIDSVLIDLEAEMFSELREIWGKVDKQISKIELDTLKNVISKEDYDDYRRKHNMYVEQNLLLENNISCFYRSVKVSELGWINIDKFAPEEKKASIKFSFNQDVDATKTYIIDERNNTILNVFEDTIDIPMDRSFLIISFGIKDDTFYGFKKMSRFSESSRLYNVDLKKINKSQIKSFLEFK